MGRQGRTWADLKMSEANVGACGAQAASGARPAKVAARTRPSSTARMHSEVHCDDFSKLVPKETTPLPMLAESCVTGWVAHVRFKSGRGKESSGVVHSKSRQ